MIETNSSIYYEALWVLSLFAATSILREAFGELCVHSISKSILSCSHISGETLDVFLSCSNSGRSLGFGAAWRMWNIDKSKRVISRKIIVLPFSCWIIGMPIKLVAVSAVRGGNPYLGEKGTWALGILWIVLCIVCKIVAMYADKFHGLKDSNGKIISYRRIFQARFCSLESYGMMLFPQDYDDRGSFIKPKRFGPALGIDCSWRSTPAMKKEIKMVLIRRDGDNDPTNNGMDDLHDVFDKFSL